MTKRIAAYGGQRQKGIHRTFVHFLAYLRRHPYSSVPQIAAGIGKVQHSIKPMIARGLQEGWITRTHHTLFRKYALTERGLNFMDSLDTTSPVLRLIETMRRYEDTHGHPPLQREIAAEMGITEGAVVQRLQVARQLEFVERAPAGRRKWRVRRVG